MYIVVGASSSLISLFEKEVTIKSKVLNNVMENTLTPGIIRPITRILVVAAKVFKALRYIIKKWKLKLVSKVHGALV